MKRPCPMIIDSSLRLGITVVSQKTVPTLTNTNKSFEVPRSLQATRRDHPSLNMNWQVLHRRRGERLPRDLRTSNPPPHFFFEHRRILEKLHLFEVIFCSSTVTKRRQRFGLEFLLVVPRQLFMFDHEKANDRCDGSQTRIENENQFEACCVPMREYVAGHRRRQSQ